MAHRAEHAPRRGIVKRLLRYALEGHFRSLSCKTRICNVFDAALTEQWGVRHDLHVRMGELPSKLEGVGGAVDVGTCPRRVRRENPDITSPLTKKTFPADFITFPQVPRTARAEVTSFVRETRAKVDDLKGRPPHVTVRLRVLVQKLASVSSH